MAVTVTSGCVVGIEGVIILIEIQTFNQLNKFIIGGLADTAIQEAKERVQFAIVNSNYHFTKKGIAINLVPAQMRKEGSQLDLAMAIGLMIITKQFKIAELEHTIFLGELGLEGDVRGVPGAIAILLHAVKKGYTCAYISAENIFEASLIADKLTIFSLEKLIDIECPNKVVKSKLLSNRVDQSLFKVDFKNIVGNIHAKRALVIAAAGGHNVLLTGPPGTGKSLLAKGFLGLLPTLNEMELLTIATIQSISGELLQHTQTVLDRPFRAPHHSASANAIIGGGVIPKPGAITLAHLGVLFLDEFPEFHSDVLESLREPLEEGNITIARTRGSTTFPASFQLIAAMNPCPCGYNNDKEVACTCNKYAKARYLKKLSGPILDRIDIFSFVPRLNKNQIWQNTIEQSSAEWLKVIEETYQTQIKRQGTTNAKLPLTLATAQKALNISPAVLMALSEIKHISTRGLVRLLKVSRTIADLSNQEMISTDHINEAINYRCNFL